jgi:hypothetical protein
MSSIDSSPHTASPRSRSRRRLAAWLAFGVIGLALGAVWATGFIGFTGANGATAESPAMAKGTPADNTSALSGVATKVNDLTFDWAGRWGSVPADKILVKVDLSGAQFNGKTYNVAVLLTNTSDLTEYASLQLNFENAYKAAGGACAAADYDGTQHSKVMNIDDEDAGVYWNALPGDAVYCVGIAQAPGDDIAGTFIRSAQDAFPTHWPAFVTTVDRAS